MAQLRNVRVSTQGWPIPQNTPTAVPGLAVTLLTSSGWIRISTKLCIYTSGGSMPIISIALMIDGVLIPQTSPYAAKQNVVMNYYYTVAEEWFFQLGAGEHAFALYLCGTTTSGKLSQQVSEMTVWDLGI